MIKVLFTFILKLELIRVICHISMHVKYLQTNFCTLCILIQTYERDQLLYRLNCQHLQVRNLCTDVGMYREIHVDISPICLTVEETCNIWGNHQIIFCWTLKQWIFMHGECLVECCWKIKKCYLIRKSIAFNTVLLLTSVMLPRHFCVDFSISFSHGNTSSTHFFFCGIIDDDADAFVDADDLLDLFLFASDDIDGEPDKLCVLDDRLSSASKVLSP